MIEAAAEHGYGGASVAQVIERAGVSRATFYQQFEDRDDCFRAAYRKLAEPVRSRVEELERQRPDAGLLRQALSELLVAADAQPAATKVSAIEVLAAEIAVREEHDELIDFFEAAFDRGLARTEVPSLGIPTRALLGGVGSAITIRVFRGETGLLRGLRRDLLIWIDSYLLSPGERRPDAAEWEAMGVAVLARQPGAAQRAQRRPLARGRSAMSAGAVAGSHRERILAAIASCSWRDGYRATTVADVVSAANVSREAFYEQFRSKEDAFLAALELALQRTISEAAREFFSGATWPDRVWNGLRATLAYMGSNPDLLALGIVESYAAGKAAVARTFENRMAYTLFLEDGYRHRPQAEGLPRFCSEVISGAISELIRVQARRGRAEQMLELLPQVVYVALAPFTGHDEALRLVRRRSVEAG